METVFVIILNWNRADDTTDCLKTVAKLNTTGFNIKILVVDNGSNASTLSKLKKFQKDRSNLDLRIVENQQNLGFAGGNNVGIKYAIERGADYVLVLNNDTLVGKNCVYNLVKAAKKIKKAGALSPKIYFAKGYEFHKERYKKRDLGKVIWYAGGKIDWDNIQGKTKRVDEVDSGEKEKIEETDFATGTCMLLTKIALEKTGFFDEKYFLYYEDTDLSVRIRKAGFKVLFVPKALLWHKVSQSSGIGSSLNDYFISRNRMLFGMRYASLRAKFALIRESIKNLLLGRKWQRIGIRDYYLARFGRGSWKT